MSNIAKDLLSRYWDGTLPVNVNLIARQMGLRVAGELSLRDSGYVRREEGGVVIHYNATEAHVRQRFTIAHEIGHYALGHLEGQQVCFRDPPHNFSARSNDSREREANAFAAELLMPEKVLRYVILEKGLRDIGRLANLFNVSSSAMSYRLVNLGILNAYQEYV